MEEFIASVLGSIDDTTIKLCLIVFVVMFILGLVKKVAKVAILAFAVIIVLAFMNGATADFQSKNYIRSAENGIELAINGEQYNIDKNTVERMELQNGELQVCKFVVYFTKESGLNTLKIDIPAYLIDIVSKFAAMNGIDIVDTTLIEME